MGLGISSPDPAVLRKFVGPPPWDAFMEFYGFTREQAGEAVLKFRQYYREKGIFENNIYPGIPALLEELTSAGRVLALATSKPTVFAEQVLEHFSMSGHFAFVAGSEESGERCEKPDVIRHALENLGLTPDRAVMVGDRKFDVLGARAVGLPCIGVLYGYGSPRELEEAGADFTASDPAELGKLLQGAIPVVT